MRVLEIGCNAGMHGWHIAKDAEFYLGVEPFREYFDQAMVTLDIKQQQAMENPQRAIYNHGLKELVKKQFYGRSINALFGSFVLYHLSDKEVKQLRKDVLPMCKVVVITNRTSERVNRVTKNHYKLELVKNVEKILVDAGFETEVVWPTYTKKFYGVIGHAKDSR